MLTVGWEAFRSTRSGIPSRPPDSPALPRPTIAAPGSWWLISFGGGWFL